MKYLFFAMFLSFSSFAIDIADYDNDEYVIRLGDVRPGARINAYKALVGKYHEALFLKHLRNPWSAHDQLQDFLKIAKTRKRIRAARLLLKIFPHGSADASPDSSSGG